NGTYSAAALGSPGAITNDPDTSASFSSATHSKVTVPAFEPVVDFTIEGWTNLDEYLPATNKTLYGALGTVRLLVRDPPTSLATAYASVWLNGTEYVLQPFRNYLASDTNHNVWVHWVLTRHANMLRLYRNGAQVAVRSDLPPTAPANLNGTIGLQSNGNYPLTGRIDEVALYSNALSAV
ncbi:LamG domain-containing protein, partial [Salmonella enterica subsp. enterica serovar Senftenberg]|nr:LamG domain-containing protein [Salmonella enterica subsp. enterica serovar Senftenberg]